MKKLRGFDARVMHIVLASTIAGLLQAGSALAALELRDINGNPTANTANAEFAYDTVLDATWYLRTNIGTHLGFDPIREIDYGTGVTWGAAKSWAEGLTVGGFSGWSLPTTDPACGFQYHCTNSQMGELYYTALGFAAADPFRVTTGPFRYIASGLFWSSTVYVPPPGVPWFYGTESSWYFGMSGGNQYATGWQGTKHRCSRHTPWRRGRCRAGARDGRSAVVRSCRRDGDATAASRVIGTSGLRPFVRSRNATRDLGVGPA